MITPGPPYVTGQERARLGDSMQALTEMCMVLSPELDVVAASDRYLELLQKTGREVIGRPILDVLPDRIIAGSDLTRESIKNSLDCVIRERSSSIIISERDVAGNSEKRWAISHTPLLDAGGRQILLIIHSLHDAAGVAHLAQNSTQLPDGESEVDQSRLAKQLRNSEDRFHDLLEGASDAVLEVAEDGNILLANSTATAMFGYTEQEMVGHEVEKLLVPDARREAHRQHRAGYSHSPRIRRMGNGRELSACRKDGSVFPVEISLIPLWSHEKRSVIAIVHDISKRKRMEEKLRQAQQLEALGRLAGGTAHEFNNLLAVIMGSAELITIPPGLEQQNSTHVDRIRRAARQAGELARQLLTFGRRQMLSTEILDLNSALVEMSLTIAELLGDAIEFHIHAAGAPVWIQADRLQIEQVITNLLTNARSAMPHGGKLRIAVASVDFNLENGRANPGLAPGRYALLSVTDNGTGMTPDVKARLFEPFFTTKGLAEATGMGLATAYGIITQSGGTISVESQPDQGSTFNLYLPIPDDDAVKSALLVAPARDSTAGNETILLLEDQPDLLMLTAEFLRLNGYRVLSASRPDEALRLETNFKGTIHLLITDILMPGMDGREFASKCKAVRPGLPVLYVSGYTADVLEQLQPGEAFMAKPFATEELGMRVREMLRRKLPKGA